MTDKRVVFDARLPGETFGDAAARIMAERRAQRHDETTSPRVEAAEKRREFRELLHRSSLGEGMSPHLMRQWAAELLATTEPAHRSEVLAAMAHEPHCTGYGAQGPLTREPSDCGCIAGESVDRLVDAGLLEVNE